MGRFNVQRTFERDVVEVSASPPARQILMLVLPACDRQRVTRESPRLLLTDTLRLHKQIAGWLFSLGYCGLLERTIAANRLRS